MKFTRTAKFLSLPGAILLSVFIVALPSRGFAQDIPLAVHPGVDRLVGGIVGMVPEYEGSDSYKAAGAPLLHFRFSDYRYAQVIANKAYLNLLNNRNFEAGLKGVYRNGRVNADDNDVDKLPSVDSSFELGGFVAYKKFFGQNPEHRWVTVLGLTQDVSDGHKGFVGEFSSTYWRPLTKRFSIAPRVVTSYASDDYMSSFFDVSGSGAAATGLSSFSADAGFKDIGVGLLGLFHITQNWHVGGGYQYKHLLSDAADSPIVDDRGSKGQHVLGLSVMYTWQRK